MKITYCLNVLFLVLLAGCCTESEIKVKAALYNHQGINAVAANRCDEAKIDFARAYALNVRLHDQQSACINCINLRILTCETTGACCKGQEDEHCCKLDDPKLADTAAALCKAK